MPFLESLVYTVVLICSYKLLWPFLRVLLVYTVGKLFSKRSLLKAAGDWAIVTGATAGIGRAYAEELAKEGLNIMIISRNIARFKATAQKIESTYHVKTVIVQCDFTETNIYEKLTEEINKLGSIACLVNNVGIAYPNWDRFADAPFIDVEFIRRMINCNANSVASLTRIVLPLMIKRNKPGCAIINMSSYGGLVLFPYMALYGATKSFVNHLTKTLSWEAANANITFQTVCPMFVATEMSGVKRPRLFIPSAEVYAKSALDMLGVESVTQGYFPHALQAAALSLHPRLVVWQAEKLYQKALRRK